MIDGACLSINDVFMTPGELFTLITTSEFDSIILHTIDTFILTCVLQNHRINTVAITGAAGYCLDTDTIDLLSNKQITVLDFNGPNGYFISQLHKFQYLQKLELDRVLNNKEAAELIIAIEDTNITHLHINIVLKRPANTDTQLQFSGLFTNKSLIHLHLSIASMDTTGHYMPMDLFDGLATNKTITYLYIQIFQPMTREVIDHFSSALATNESISTLELMDYSKKFDNKVIAAICESKSIKHFETFGKTKDVDSFIYLVRHSKLTTLNMPVVVPHNVVIEAIAENFCICHIEDDIVDLHGDIKKYLERNRRLQYHLTHPCLVDFAMIFVTLPFDPYVIVKIFDEMYEPAGANFYCARKIATIYSIRNSIEAIKNR